MGSEAWEELSARDEDSAWDMVSKQLEFKPSVRVEHFHGFKEPAPSLTYSISSVYSEHQDELEADLNLKALQTFREMTSKDEFILALDWQHTCYKFFPHKMSSSCGNNWAISPLPNGDYYIFIEQNLKYGWLDHPWEQTICLFGDQLLEAIKSNKPKLFRNPIRMKDRL